MVNDIILLCIMVICFEDYSCAFQIAHSGRRLSENFTARVTLGEIRLWP